MSVALLTRFTDERQTLVDLIDTTLGRADAENRDLVDAENEALESAQTRLAEVDAQIERVKGVLERRNSTIDLTQVLANSTRKAATQTASVQVNEPAPALSSFVDSPQFRDYGFSGASDRMRLDARITETRAPHGLETDPSKLFLPSNQKLMIPQGVAEFPLLAALTRIPCATNAVDMVVYGSPKGATGAAVVPEGGRKPEAQLVASEETVKLETQAFWVEVTRQLMQDAPAFKTFADEQLRTGLLSKLETDAINVIEDATYNVVTQGDDVFEAIRYGIADVQTRGYRPNAILTDPFTAAALDIQLLKILQGFGGNPWLTPIPVPGMTPGRVLVGDFAKGAAFLERTQIEVYVSDSGVSGNAPENFKDRFTHNLFVILAETRAKTVVVQPAAISEVKPGAPFAAAKSK